MELEFGLEDLPAVRRAVGSLAEEAGLSDQRTEEVVLAVNEISTNAVIHGRPPSTMRAWHGAGEIVVEVADAGEGIQDVLAGQLTPSAGGLGGRGLWLTRLLCDAVEVRCDQGGCTVTVHIATRERRTGPQGCLSTPPSISLVRVKPLSVMVRSSSASRPRRTVSTPFWPSSARPHR